MADLWGGVLHNPYLLFLLIIIGTYILEDLAIITAALMSADGLIDPYLAFYALYIGIFSGDLALYGCGFLLKKGFLKNWVGRERVIKAQEWLTKRVILSIFVVRLVPGLRLPTYTACGLLGINFFKFTALIAVASLVWTGIIYSGVLAFGSMFWEGLSEWKWLLVLILASLIIYVNKRLTCYFDRHNN